MQTLSLANNNLTGEHLLPLNRFLPNLVNLSLHKNNIRDRKDLFGISSNRGKLAHLQELILTENPIRIKAYAAGKADTYRRYGLACSLLHDDIIIFILLSFTVRCQDSSHRFRCWTKRQSPRYPLMLHNQQRLAFQLKPQMLPLSHLT